MRPVRRPGFIQRMIERDRATPRTKVDLWMQRQREYVLRLPKWLVGTWVVSSLAFAIWCLVYNRGLTPLIWDDTTNEGGLVLFIVGLTFLLLMIPLYVIARIVRPPARTNLPDARINQ
jgi:hypothetical protein